MSKMEEDPLVTQRMRDIARTQMCDSHASAYNKCGGEQVNDLICVSCIFFKVILLSSHCLIDLWQFISLTCISGYESCLQLSERVK